MEMTSIKDVAAQAGVSIATVSRVFSDSVRVREETRKRVHAAANALGYRPNVNARNLRRRREDKADLNYTIGLVYQGRSLFQRSGFDLKLAAHIEAHLRALGYAMRLVHIADELSSAEHVDINGIDALIVTNSNAIIPQLAQLLPTLLIDSYVPSSGIFGILPDYQMGLQLAIEHLFEHGHEQIVVCCHDQSVQRHSQLNIGFAHLIKQGMQQAYQDAGKHLPATAFAGDANTAESGYRICESICKRGVPDAIIASDSAMLGIYQYLNQHNILIGKDISLIGIDGLPDTEFFHPPLTVIDVHIDELARYAVERLCQSLDKGERLQGMELIPTTLTKRKSVRLK